MGNRQQDKKHLVIVGGSFAGLILVDRLKHDFNITLVEKKDHFEWVCAMPKYMVDHTTFPNATVNLKQCIEVDQVFGQHVQYIQGMATELVDKHSLRIKRTDSVSETQSLNDVAEEVLNFDFLVFCTGTHYAVNEKEVEKVVSLFNLDSREKFFKGYSDKIEEAQSILIVGGGATGVECLAEMYSKYGNQKTYGLVNGADQLLSGFPNGSSRKALNHFERRNVEIMNNTKVNLHDENPSDLFDKYDFTIMCVGQKAYSPFMDKNFSNYKDKSGRIYVNQYFQIIDENPMDHDLSDSNTEFGNILCYGDACLTRMSEPKNVPSIRETSYIVAQNLKSLAYGGNLTEMPYAVDNIAGVYFGKCSGTMNVNDFSLGFFLTPVAKSFIETTYTRFYRNRCCGKCMYKFYNFAVNLTSCCLNKCCCCCPCSKRRRRRERREELRKIFASHKEE